MRQLFLFTIAFFLCANSLLAQEYTYPDKTWVKVSPEKHGYDSKKLKEARKYIIDSLQTTGLSVVVGGEVIYQFGNNERISYIASCRKSVLAMMYGKYVENGTINLKATVGKLGLDDIEGLLPSEKEATVYDLITARSGVYHSASNGGDDADSRPARGSKKHGKYFLYNNWDFNVAGEIFEMLTKKNIYEAFKEDIADRVGMEDFELANQRKGGNLKISRYPAYHFYMSTRDMARIGYLMLRNGKWKDDQVISQKWVKDMVSVVTPLKEMNPVSRRDIFEYGYMWWLFQVPECPVLEGAYTARGAMGQYITVIPELDMVIAHKTDAVYERRTSWVQYYKLVKMIIEAKEQV